MPQEESFRLDTANFLSTGTMETAVKSVGKLSSAFDVSKISAKTNSPKNDSIQRIHHSIIISFHKSQRPKGFGPQVVQMTFKGI